jgi:hypothetical protein
MDVNEWTIKDKPYDLRERLFNFLAAGHWSAQPAGA